MPTFLAWGSRAGSPGPDCAAVTLPEPLDVPVFCHNCRASSFFGVCAPKQTHSRSQRLFPFNNNLFSTKRKKNLSSPGLYIHIKSLCVHDIHNKTVPDLHSDLIKMLRMQTRCDITVCSSNSQGAEIRTVSRTLRSRPS